MELVGKSSDIRDLLAKRVPNKLYEVRVYFGMLCYDAPDGAKPHLQGAFKKENIRDIEKQERQTTSGLPLSVYS